MSLVWAHLQDVYRMGLLRNLSVAQIVEQLVEAKRLLAETGEDFTATNIVFMGMGAPPR
jgi:23S rRNA (adenine2503-C2)-methyltransferase